ncbi:MAG: hypothetical protein R3E82_09765 [Pseudomonadales bacterium]
MSDTCRVQYPGFKCAIAALLCLAVFPAGAEVPDVLLRCQAMAEAQSRLACYDSAMDRLTATPSAPAQATPTQSATVNQPTSASTPTPSTPTPSAPTPSAPTGPTTSLTPTEMFGREESASRDLVKEVIGSTQLDFIEAEVAVVQRTAYGELIIELDNGQLWRQIDSRSLRLKPGERVRISAASIGSFLLEKVSGSTSIRVRRQK